MNSLRRTTPWLVASAFLATPLLAQGEAGPADGGGDDAEVVVVRITDEGFRPATVTVEHGVVLRYLQLSSSPHNVEFVRVPKGTRMAPDYVPNLSASTDGPTAMPPLRFGPYLIGAGDTYDVSIDEYLAEGLYEYRCASHGYRGLLLVLDDLAL